VLFTFGLQFLRWLKAAAVMVATALRRTSATLPCAGSETSLQEAPPALGDPRRRSSRRRASHAPTDSSAPRPRVGQAARGRQPVLGDDTGVAGTPSAGAGVPPPPP